MINLDKVSDNPKLTKYQIDYLISRHIDRIRLNYMISTDIRHLINTCKLITKLDEISSSDNLFISYEEYKDYCIKLGIMSFAINP